MGVAGTKLHFIDTSCSRLQSKLNHKTAIGSCEWLKDWHIERLHNVHAVGQKTKRNDLALPQSFKEH